MIFIQIKKSQKMQYLFINKIIFSDTDEEFKLLKLISYYINVLNFFITCKRYIFYSFHCKYIFKNFYIVFF